MQITFSDLFFLFLSDSMLVLLFSVSYVLTPRTMLETSVILWIMFSVFESKNQSINQSINKN